MSVRRSAPVDRFELAYESDGAGLGVVLLHGWPGDRHDYDLLAPMLTPRARVIVPDLRGFGESDKHDVDPRQQYDAHAQARSVAALVDELSLGPIVAVGYDVGSRVAQTLARSRPDLVCALVLAPPLPGAGRRVLDPGAQREYWYQTLHDLPLVEQLLDGRPDTVRAYLAYFWQHWSGPSYRADPSAFDRLVRNYSVPGAFRASVGWYRAGARTAALHQQPPSNDERIAVPTTVLWPELDPLFPREWSDHLDEYFADVTLQLVDGVGHFAPLEYPDTLATAILNSP